MGRYVSDRHTPGFWLVGFKDETIRRSDPQKRFKGASLLMSFSRARRRSALMKSDCVRSLLLSLSRAFLPFWGAKRVPLK